MAILNKKEIEVALKCAKSYPAGVDEGAWFYDEEIQRVYRSDTVKPSDLRSLESG